LSLGKAHFHQLLNFQVFRVAHRKLLNPVSGSFSKLLGLIFVHACYNSVLRIVRFWCTEKCLKWDKSSADCKSWSPLIFQNVKTDRTCLRRNIGMPDFSLEFHLKFG
jgi:hypothetical protein